MKASICLFHADWQPMICTEFMNRRDMLSEKAELPPISFDHSPFYITLWSHDFIAVLIVLLRSLRMSICGIITSDQTCGGADGTWCFEEVHSSDESCIAGIASWCDESMTFCFPSFNSFRFLPGLLRGEDTSTGTIIEYQAMCMSFSMIHIGCKNQYVFLSNRKIAEPFMT